MKLPLFWLSVLSIAFVSCVQTKKYQAELVARSESEARERVLTSELHDRKTETASLTKQIADVNRQLGIQDKTISDLNKELESRTQILGESSNKLAAEIGKLEKELSEERKMVEQKTAIQQKVLSVQKERQSLLAELQSTLTKAYAGVSGVAVTVEGDAVALVLPDKGIFDATGVAVSAQGKTMLKPLAELLANRPELDVDVVAYTDNVLPKDKTIKDTWDWSLLRATNLIRMLIREYNTNANQLSPIGRGEFYPITSNATPEGRTQNRRSVMLVKPVLPAVPTAE
ncbi:MAG: OmpA family protein [Saprospiraceae bacterium]|nr:OmpA family protein [Saprospiraceae bacterium]